MSNTDFIALLAFFISLYGAILSTYTAINEFFRLKLSIINQDKSFITFTKSDKYLDEYGEYLGIYKKNFYIIEDKYENILVCRNLNTNIKKYINCYEDYTIMNKNPQRKRS